MRLFTIGFTKKKAREFFGLLSDSGGQGFSNSPRRSTKNPRLSGGFSLVRATRRTSGLSLIHI